MRKARKTIKAGDLPPDADVTIGEPEEEEPKPPPSNEHFEVWEGYTYNDGVNQSWPPRRRVRGWVSEDSAYAYVKAFTKAHADEAALKEKPITKYYVAVRVEMKRSLA